MPADSQPRDDGLAPGVPSGGPRPDEGKNQSDAPREAATEASTSEADTRETQDAGKPSSSDRPAWRKIPGIGRMRTASRALGASVGVIAAIASVIVGYLAIPKGITSEDWTRRVNAVCEQNAGELREPLGRADDALDSLNTLLQDPANFGAAGADLNTISNDIQDTADSYRRVIGQIRELDRPEETSGIDALLNSGSEFYRSLDSTAANLSAASTAIANFAATPKDLDLQAAAQQQLDTLQGVIANDAKQSLEDYQSAADGLRLEQCDVFLSPATGTDQPTNVTGGLNEDEAALARKLGIDPSQCSRYTGPDMPSGGVARLHCSVPGFEQRLLFIGFASAADLRTFFAPQEDQQADCGAGESAEYDLPAAPQPGRLRCFALGQEFRINVMLTGLMTMFAAEANGPIGLERQVNDFVSGLDPN